jgi:CBS domain containing-hemolysin-like protein
MITDQLFLLGAGAILVLLACSAFFSGAEIALFSLERHRLEAMREREAEDARVGTLSKLREDPHRLLVTILVGNNLVNVAMATLAGALLTEALGPGVGVAVATAVMSVLILLFGEITPKSYGVANPESLSLSVAGPIAAIQVLLYPLVAVFDGVSGAINRVTGGKRDIEAPYVTREEIEALLETGELVGAIDETEREMVRGVFDLGSTRAREVMVPRVNVVGVDVASSVAEALTVCADERLTRLPVYDGTLDHIVGIVDVRDLVRADREGLDLREVVTDVVQVPDTRDVDDLLAEMQRERVPMVIVRDEFGETEGIVTVEDIIEEIVGEITEEGEARPLRRTADGLVVRGEVTVGEVNDALGVDLPQEGEYETVAGLINAELGRIGDVADRLEFDDVSLVVERVDGNRIRRVRVHHQSADASATGANDSADGVDAAMESESPSVDRPTDARDRVDGTDGTRSDDGGEDPSNGRDAD